MNTPVSMSEYQEFIHTSRYARWLPDEQRRETWTETVDRYIDNVVRPVWTAKEGIVRLRELILSQDIMPSMRAMMTAGPAATRDNTCMYNCAYLPVDSVTSFVEAQFILLCGTGVGFSVERQNINKLPEVPYTLDSTGAPPLVVEDSKEGWSRAFYDVLQSLYSGFIPTWDVSLVRPAGTPLKTFGGRASGPGPLVDLFKFTIATFTEARGRKLSSIECHDLMCKIGETVVVGGVRRSAMISLSNLSDDRMRRAKSGNWYDQYGYRALANNSTAYTEKPDAQSFMTEFLALIESKSGERGIFSRQAAEYKAQENRRRETGHQWGTNPCGEIILRPRQFCNLSEIVARSGDTEVTLQEKAQYASILGTIQSTYCWFPFLNELNEDWTVNTKEERLLGVSLTGICDNYSLSDSSSGYLPVLLNNLKERVVKTNQALAFALGISPSVAATCVKPSGTVSQLVDSASGIHTRHSEYYIRTVRGDNNDPLTKFMIAQGFPHEPCVMKPEATTVFSFPQKAPYNALLRDDLSAIEQLELWSVYQTYWCEHNPSVTITVRDSEWVDVAAWVFDNFSICAGLSFLPHSDHVYQQAPYQECDEVDYAFALSEMPTGVDWSGLSEYELEDHTKSSQTMACVGDFCELVDI